jgi:type IV pilus assembly protein PilE
VKNNTGFTLLELMVTVLIVGILVAMAVPQYNNYIDRSNRAAMQADLMRIASALERVRAVQLTYANAKLTDANIYGSAVYPVGSSGTKVLYNLTLGPSNSASTAATASADITTTWEISAAPANRQAKDGMMKLNSLGQSCWNKGNATSCNVTDATQSWRNK